MKIQRTIAMLIIALGGIGFLIAGCEKAETPPSEVEGKTNSPIIITPSDHFANVDGLLEKAGAEDFLAGLEFLFIDKIDTDKNLITLRKKRFIDSLTAIENEIPFLKESYSSAQYTSRYVNVHQPTEGHDNIDKMVKGPYGGAIAIMARVERLDKDGVDQKPYNRQQYKEDVEALEDNYSQIYTLAKTQFTKKEIARLHQMVNEEKAKLRQTPTTKELFDLVLSPKKKGDFPTINKAFDQAHQLAKKRSEMEADLEAAMAERFYMLMEDIVVNKEMYLEYFNSVFIEDMETIDPVVPYYKGLQNGLEQYRKFSAGNPDDFIFSANSEKLKEGATSPVVALIKKRLAAEGYFSGTVDEAWGKNLTAALSGYQKNHQLPVTGLCDFATLAAFNVPMEMRVAQIRLALKRLRESPGRWLESYIRVNIPGMKLDVCKKDLVVYDCPVFVGKNQSGSRTSLGSDNIEAVYTTPITDKLRCGLSEGTSTKPDRIGLFIGGAEGLCLCDAGQAVSEKMPVRDRSLGCVMTDNASTIVDEFVSPKNKAGLQSVLKAFRLGRTASFDFEKPIPVFFEYLPAIADESGEVAFFPDVYGLDQSELKALLENPLPAL